MDSLVPPSPERFEHIAHIQVEKEIQVKQHRRASSAAMAGPPNTATDNDVRDDAAARVIQKTFRGYRARREFDGYGLSASSRWASTVRDAQFRESVKPLSRTPGANSKASGLAAEGQTEHRPSSARQNWKKASLVARRALHDDSDTESDEDDSSESGKLTIEEKTTRRDARQKATQERRQAARMMGLQYFLEMVDSKHRYGSNLRSYHEEWKKSNSKENFFYWLDHGEGKKIELDACPRERLEREQVRYLSRDERQYYLVKVDSEGRLCWAKNGARIDTAERFKDSIHGIVPVDDPTPAFNPTAAPADDSGDDSDSDSSAESKREADRAAKYATPEFDEATGFKKVSHISASTIFNKMLRKSVKKNTWIFVADTSFRLYVGIKDSGAFQHSSFLQGARISAAGLIKIKNGRLTSLSPLSGHYRPPASNFKAFVKNLKGEGVDMSHTTLSKSYAVLVGLEAYVKTRRKGKDLVGKLVHHRDKIIAPEELKQREEDAKDTSQSAEREREVLEQEKQEQEERDIETSTAAHAMHKLKIAATGGQ